MAHNSRGVRQGLVLSPTLFLLVMDPLLRDFQTSGVGLSINSFYAGGFFHADDIRTLASSETSLMKQFDMVKLFAKKHHLKLNVTKCENVVFANRPSGADNLPVCDVDGVAVPSGDVGKCLGYWWKGDLFSSKSIEENINKARRAFLHFGSIGVFFCVYHQDLCWRNVWCRYFFTGWRIGSSRSASWRS